MSSFVFFGYLFAGLTVGILLQHRFLSLLRAHRPPLGDDILSGPGRWSNNLSFMRFLHFGDYRRLGDRRITRFGNILRLYSWAYVVLAWLAILMSFFIENRLLS